MGDRRSLVVTAYGQNKTIDKIAVRSFENSESSYNNHESDAINYCETINSLELKGDAWVFAQVLSENTQYSLDAFLPLKFSDVILKLDDRAIQKILREVDSRGIAMALKGEAEAIKEKIFNNMSKKASQMLKEDMEFMGPARITDVKENQEKILNIIRKLDDSGEIIIPYLRGETTE